MKFLIHGNSPSAKTGYGIQIAQLAEQLKADGHEPACSSTYGNDGGYASWRGIPVYGRGYDINSNDRIHMHAGHWFAGDPGWIITLIDVWAMKNPVLASFNVAAWVPIDHFLSTGPQPNICEFFNMTDATPIAMSRFGEDLLRRKGLDPVYIPLSVDTSVFTPTPDLLGETGRKIMAGGQDPIPEDAFVVSMVAMNKGWAQDRKGFCEAFQAFALFEREHPDAYLYVHADAPGGAEGIDLHQLAIHSGIPPQKIYFAGGADQYAYYLNFTAEMMAAVFTATDVLLAPSHGEGFCVPIIEAHACGTPVIATNFSAQAELVEDGVTGWFVGGQKLWDPAHHAWYVMPYIDHIAHQLEEAYKTDRAAMAPACIAHAADYDVAAVYENYWKPFIAELEGDNTQLELSTPREAMPHKDAVAVLCPIYKRTENIPRLIKSFKGEPNANLYFIVGHDEYAEAERLIDGEYPLIRVDEETSCGFKWNVGYQSTIEPWVLLIGDDVQFHPGWLDSVRDLSAQFDVIGTNDSKPPRVRHPKIAMGVHADHFFVRRQYVEEYGASLEGPGILAPECYGHWFVDAEMIRLARCRGVWSPCLDSVVEHHHPAYDGREDLRQSDETYMKAVETKDADHATYKERLPLIEQQRMSRGHA